MSTQHTQGPWRVTHQINTSHAFDIVAPQPPEGELIARCGYSRDKNSTIAANARLIAAAPDMFYALLKCEDLLDDYPEVEQQVRAAIAKATAK